MYVATDLTLSSYIHLLLSDIDLHINPQQFPYLRQRLTRREKAPVGMLLPFLVESVLL